MHRNDLTIRQAELGDAAEIASVYIASRKLLQAYAPLTHSDKAIVDWVANTLIPSCDVTTALMNHKIIGLCVTSHEKGFNWINQLYVHPQYINQGVGTALLKSTLRKLQASVRLYTFQANANASRFYEQHGFVAIEFSDGANNEERAADILYEYKFIA
jgi:ribosomal protein S18 acetylase RimI-like enzyme